VLPILPYWRLSAYYFFYFAFIGAFAPYFSLYLKALGFAAAEIAILISLMQVMRIVAPTLWGWLADRLGTRLLIVRASAAASLAGFCVFFFTESFSGIFVGMALMAFFWSAALPLIESITFAHLGERVGGYGRIRLWGSIGFIIAVLGLGYLLNVFPERAVLWVGAAVLGGILACAMPLPDAVAPRPVAGAAGLREVLRRSEVRALLAACFLMSAAHGALYVFYSIFLVANGYEKSTVGWMWTLGVLAEIVVFMAMPRLLRHASLRGLLLWAFGFAVLRFLMIGWGVDSVALLVLAQLMHGATFGAYHAAAIAAINEWFRGPLQARGHALYGSISFGAGGMLGGLLAGSTWDGIGPQWTFTISAMIALAGCLVIGFGWPANRERSAGV
jgi:PPP family 3-phenylpropionic acid transporter